MVIHELRLPPPGPASGALGPAGALLSESTSAIFVLEHATVGVHGWGASLGIAACGAAGGALTVAAAAGKLRFWRADEAAARDCSDGS